MRENNQYPTLVIELGNTPMALARNVNEALALTGVSAMEIWDSVKNSKLVDNKWRFKHLPWDGRIPKYLKRNNFPNGKPVERGIKLLDVDNGDVLIFQSFSEAAKHFGTSASHFHQSIPTSDNVRLFRKKYQVAYIENDFPIISKEDLEIAKGHGPKETIACCCNDGSKVICSSAKELIDLLNLSKKAVTTSLSNNKLRKIVDKENKRVWVVTYFKGKESIELLDAFVKGPANT